MQLNYMMGAIRRKGQRIKKSTANGTTYYLYSEQGLAAEYDSQGNLIVEYHYQPQSPWMTNPITQNRNGTLYYYHRDYNTALGRYIQADPMGLEGGESLWV